MPEGEPLSIRDEASVAVARQWVRQEGSRWGLPQSVVEAGAIIMSELAHNQLCHARRGLVQVRPISRDQVPGLEVVAADAGTGIADPTAALAGVRRSSGSLGIGLAGVQRLADEVDFDVRQGEGTCVWARKFAAPVRPRPEIAVLGRPCGGERCSGDQGIFLFAEGRLILCLVDGLGHGEQARHAADLAVAAVRSQAAAANVPGTIQMLQGCRDTLRGTRGAVLALIQISESGDAECVCIGNINIHLYSGGQTRLLPCQPGVVGLSRPRQPSRQQVSRMRLAAGDILVLSTDGVAGRPLLEAMPTAHRGQALVLAHQILQQHGRTQDDALVLVARWPLPGAKPSWLGTRPPA